LAAAAEAVPAGRAGQRSLSVNSYFVLSIQTDLPSRGTEPSQEYCKTCAGGLGQLVAAEKKNAGCNCFVLWHLRMATFISIMFIKIQWFRIICPGSRSDTTKHNPRVVFKIKVRPEIQLQLKDESFTPNMRSYSIH